MKHIKRYNELFESTQEISDADVIKKIMDSSNESWFLEGDDPPEGFLNFIGDFESEDEEIQEIIEVCTGGPGYTDMWIEAGELIDDALSDDPEMTEEEIEKSNREWFSRERKKAIDFIQNKFLSPRGIIDRIHKEPKILDFIEKLDPNLYQRTLKELGWDKMGPDLLRQLKAGIF
jgi:hypothetical protein